MTLRNVVRFSTVALMALLSMSCSERDTSTLEPEPPNNDPYVFLDEFGDGVDFQAFQGSNLSALAIDTSERHQGSASLKLFVPDLGDPEGAWAGGAFTTNLARDLSSYNALTFWAKSSVPTTLNVAGLGNDNTGSSKYTAEWHDIPLTTSWTKYAIPIPLPAKLTSEKGLFFLAEGPEGNVGHLVWFDEIRFENLTTISNPRPAMTPQTVGAFVGATVNVTGTKTTFSVGGTDQTILHMPGYFTFLSSNDLVAAITDGVIQVVGGGEASISAKLGEIQATGVVVVNATAPPATPAPTPAIPEADVISLFSNAYENVEVDTWSAGWGNARQSDLQIAGDDVKAYTNLVFAGIEFTTQTIDATSMTHFHLDLWVPGGTVFRVKLVDFGADGTFGGAPDSEHEISFTASTTPPLATGTWVALEIPLTRFTGLVTRAHVAQLIISGDVGTAYLDNIYFHK